MNQTDILRFDKITRLEGICIEELFFNTFLRNDALNTSCGWWASKHATNSFHIIKHVLDKISKLDVEIATKLAYNAEVYFVKKIDDQFRFHHFSSKDEISDIRNGISNGRLLPIKRSQLNKKIISKEHEERMTKVLSFLKSIDSDLSKIVESRELANYYGSNIMWDIDYFVKFEDQLVAFEVKQKYPSKKEVFGLNKGSYGVLKFLYDCGFNVQHVVLTKPVRDRHHSAIELLSGRFKSRSKWLAHKFNNASFRSSISTSPKYTSFSQERPLDFFSESISSFIELGSLDDSGPKTLIEYLEN